MKVLAWYSSVMVAFSLVAMFVEMVTTTSTEIISTNIWGSVLYIPVLVFAILFLVKGKNCCK